ncbi:uncharacterized protein LOC132699806 [Cylas formicarius]|uniref:uncharacterized protein LOC132699806 n=1 Tax=Cylas formicarius TaxID=197179 RepID=UPI00295851E3|nr:uncharacterized protein LOC132699806 [Cylas formicarius]
MSSSILLMVEFIFLVCALRTTLSIPADAMHKRTIPESSPEELPDYQLGVRYDEYPTIVPKKRTALLVNRLMLALRDAMEAAERERGTNFVDGYMANKKFLTADDVRSMDLQRRGHQSISNLQGKGRIYWRCYFNAVTCF